MQNRQGDQDAEDGLEVARANYDLAFAGASNNAPADAAIISARRTLSETLLGPKESELNAARLQVTQAELALEQARLKAPWTAQYVRSMCIAPSRCNAQYIRQLL
jgi:multidrug resistance efflux pump